MLSSFAYMALILLATLTACYLVWRVGKSLRLVAARSFVFPLACFLAFIAAAWFTWVSLVDTLSVASATGWVAVFMLVFSVPVLALVSAILLAGPIVLSSNLPAVRDRLRTTPPRALANIAASFGLIFLIGGLIAFALPYYRTVDLGRQARSADTPRAELAELAAWAARERNAGLAHQLLQNPSLDDELYGRLIADCLDRPRTEGCRAYMVLLQRHPNAPEELFRLTQELYGVQPTD